MRFTLRALMLGLVIAGSAAALGARAMSVRSCAACRDVAHCRQPDGRVEVLGFYDGTAAVPVLRDAPAPGRSVRLAGPNARPGHPDQFVRVVGRAARSTLGLSHVHEIEVEKVVFIW